MSFKDELSKKVSIEKEKLPASYQRLGDVILLKLLRIENKKEKKKIGKAIQDLYPNVKTVCEMKRVKGEYREPKVKKLSGDGFETIHKEHGIKYKLDVSKIMFSKGNLSERKRLINQVKKDDIVVDMFAGIGYFSLPIAKYVKKIIAIEKNPTAYKYLNENVKLNNISNIKTINNDCRDVKLKENVNRVLMGYFPHTEKFLDKAFEIVSKKGTIHYHNTYHEDELWEKPIKEIKKNAEENGYKISNINKRKVKTIAPNVWHVVLDYMVF